MQRQLFKLALPPLALAAISCAGNGTLDGQAVPTGTISTGPLLARFYDEGVASGTGSTSWVHTDGDSQRCDFTATLGWGSVFVVVDQVTAQNRKTLDFSRFSNLVVDIKAASNGGSVQIGVKTATDADDGSEPKALISNLTTGWQTVSIPLTTFVDATHPLSRLTQLYVVFELVFSGGPSESVFFRNVRFT